MRLPLVKLLNLVRSQRNADFNSRISPRNRERVRETRNRVFQKPKRLLAFIGAVRERHRKIAKELANDRAVIILHNEGYA